MKARFLIFLICCLVGCQSQTSDQVLTPRQMAMLYRYCKPLPIIRRIEDPRCHMQLESYTLMDANLSQMRSRVSFGLDVLLAQMELGRRRIALDIARNGQSRKLEQFIKDVYEQKRVVNAKLGALHFEMLLRGGI